LVNKGENLAISPQTNRKGNVPFDMRFFFLWFSQHNEKSIIQATQLCSRL